MEYKKSLIIVLKITRNDKKINSYLFLNLFTHIKYKML